MCGAYDIAYAFKLTETVQTDLPTGTLLTGQFVGSGQAQLFRITVTNSGPLQLSLQNAGLGNHAELYVARGAPPTRGVFDFQSTSGTSATCDLLVPSASS